MMTRFLFALASASLLLGSACSQGGRGGPAAGLQIGDGTLAKAFEGKLTRLNDSEEFTSENLSPDVEYVLFYFSAHWCPPCRTFTPRLVEWYNQNHKADSNWELIFVSSDHSAEAQADYVAGEEMPWLVLNYQTAQESALIDPIRPSGIPATALLNIDGDVLAHSFSDSGTYQGPNVGPEALEALEASAE